MHGEYKAPGGKLVVADLDVVGGQIANVQVSGDFFLEPDDALDRINMAITGLPADAGVSAIARAVEGVLDDDTMLLGFSVNAVAVAIRRAVGQASDWRDHDWHLIHDGPQPPAVHMALDEVMADEVGDGRRPPTLRFWEWASPAVVIGSFQSLRNEVDPDGAARHGIDVVRRISGGGAMFIEPGNTITYSLYAPASLVAGMSFADSYAFLDDWVLGALRELGVDVWYQPLNDITSPAGKIAGAAQKRFASNTILHHVTMAYDIDAAKMMEVLRIGREKLSDKGTASAAKRVDPLRRQTGLARGDVIDSMISHFRKRYGLVDDAVTPDELGRAERLATTKFSTPEWTARIP